jgi:glycosyltransferase involved in cell wall biosynthesis
MTVIWHLLSNRWNSAITEYAISLARASSMTGMTTVMTCLRDSPAHFRTVQLGIDVRPVKDFRLGAFWTIASAKNLPDIVVNYGGPETLLSKIITSRRKKMAVIRFRGADGDATVDARTWRQRLSHSHVDLILVPSRSLQQVLSPQFSMPVERLLLGVDTQRFHVTDVPLPERPELQILGRLDPVKGHERFLAIFMRFLDIWSGPRPLLHIIGEPANLTVADLESWIRRHNLEGDVKLTPSRIENIAGTMNRAKLAVISSTGSEVICRVAEEYLLCGVPLFVSGVGSLQEFVQDSVANSYKDLGTEQAAEELARSFASALSETREQRLKRAERAREAFSLQAMGDGLKAVLAKHSLLENS